MKESFVIAISAVSGGGKTTLVKKTAQLLGATTLFFDDYSPKIDPYPDDLTQWIADGADLNEWKTPVFAKDVATLKRGESIVHPVRGETIPSNPFIVIEDPIGRGRREMAETIDFMVLIDTPLEIALARSLLRSLGYLGREVKQRIEEETQEELIEQILQFFRNQLNDYLNVFREGYLLLQKQMPSYCDMILDGCLPIDALAEQLVKAVKEKRSCQSS